MIQKLSITVVWLYRQTLLVSVYLLCILFTVSVELCLDFPRLEEWLKKWVKSYDKKAMHYVKSPIQKRKALN